MGKRLWFFCLLGALLACFAAPPLLAQTQFASVTGRVTDASGAAVAGAKVTVTNTETGVTITSATNNEGVFTVANLAPGPYSVTIEQTGFRREVRRVTLAVAQTLSLNVSLQIGALTQTVTVEETPLAINLVSGTISKEVTAQQVADLPLLTRNPYALVTTVPGAADVGAISGDTRGGQGATGEGFGFAVNGSRTSSINYMLDGGENNDTFVAGVAELVPLEAVREFKVDTSAFSAAYGRNPVNVNVVTKSGTNEIHGTLWEYYRGAGLSAATFEDNATGTPKSNFVRNDFGFVLGGPIRKDKTFAFGSFEGLRVRSKGTVNFFVPTPDFTNISSANTNGFLDAFGGIPSSNCAAASETAQDIFERIEGNGAGSYGSVVDGNVQGLYQSGISPNPMGQGLVPAGTNLFCRSSIVVPEDTGAGLPQDTWRWTIRIDHHFTDRTTLFGRYAYENARLAEGSVSFSPYGDQFSTGQRARNQNLNLTMTHTFSPRFYSESRFIYNRVFLLQPEGGPGKAPETTPCWSYDLNTQTTTGELIVFPGYVPAICVFAGIPFGGPQNIYQAYQGFTYSRGNHTFRMGGQYVHMRDNRTFGAFENAFFDTFTMQGMIDGSVDLLFASYDPKGHAPDVGPQGFYSLTSDGPLEFPSFTRHYRYNELAFYAEDSWRILPNLTITPGVRWEYFGVLHSPESERFLDANLYLNAVGPVPPVTASKNIFEQIRDARFRRTNNLYRPDWGNFSPRIGFAWDITGKGQTVLRGGYGIFWDRNFGNAVFNVIQNPPNYGVIATLASDFGVNTTIFPNQFDTLSQLTGGTSECPSGVAPPCFPVSSSARMLDNELSTAYTQQWNLSLDHEWFGKGIVTSVAYVGANGIHLYSLNNLNLRGSCLRDPEALTSVGLTCDAAGGTSSRLNQSGLTGMNRRGNEGFSRYNALQMELRTRQIGDTGLTFDTNYTFGHSVDNESSFFGDSLFEGLWGFGFRDPFNPALDRASSSNDIRHRYTLNAVWQIPWGRKMGGIAEQVLGGWTVTSIFGAQTGGAFSVYDGSTSSQCNNDGTNFCLPVVAQGGVPSMTDIASSTLPNTFTLYTLNNFQTQQSFCSSPNMTGATGLECTAILNNLFPEALSPRNLFRMPGIWNWDASVLKEFPLPREGMKLQFRAEFFNLVNHSNLYAVPGTNLFSGVGDQIVAKRGCVAASPACSGTKERRNIQLALKFFF
jgi:hypothetical protein